MAGSSISPRDRRLKTDFEAMLRLKEESSILRFTSRGTPPDQYIVTFRGPGTFRREGSQEVMVGREHTLWINLTAAYPRMIPELSWRTPIFHPNVSGSGVVCLGAYQTNWVPSLKLDELCIMLWDMIRFQNYDSESPYNREAAMWARDHQHRFPLDQRPLRDLHESTNAGPSTEHSENADREPSSSRRESLAGSKIDSSEMTFLDVEIVEAEIDDDPPSDIMFIE